jgi:GH15 family glucan-1,4-alpha-glucosidase
MVSGRPTGIAARPGSQTVASTAGRPAKSSAACRTAARETSEPSYAITTGAASRAISRRAYRDPRHSIERWRQVRDEIHAEVCERGYDPERNTFTQYYGSKELDASVLNIPLVGFLGGTDERVTGTIDAVSRELGRDGFVSRYSTDETDDGLSGDEGQFLACSFWLVTALAMNGRVDEARTLFERLVGLANDLGLLAEEYDVGRRRQVGNFPQAFSHLTLILAARAIAAAEANTESQATAGGTAGARPARAG